MALDFPDSPANGDYYNGFVYDSTSTTWRVRGSIENPAGVSSTTGSPTTTTVGDDTVYKFTADGSITIGVGGIARVLVVGGGGGGADGSGSARGGGGGAGGYMHIENYYLPAGTHTVTIGAGGTNAATFANDGGASRLGNLIVPGGGPGGQYSRSLNGASGGGAGYSDTGAYDGGDGIPGLGNDGGPKPSGTSTGAGGGGAGGIGVFASGAGGAGIANDITGSSVTYAAGGTGAQSNDSPSNATANTGNGGNGGGYPSIAGADGGSGVVIVRIGA